MDILEAFALSKKLTQETGRLHVVKCDQENSVTYYVVDSTKEEDDD